MAITHSFVSAVADGGDTNLVRPTDWNADHDVPTIEIATGTITTSTPALDITQTWNAAGTAFTGIKLDITSTAMASGSALIDLSDDGATAFKVWRTSGVFYAGSLFGFTVGLSSISTELSTTGLALGSVEQVGWSSNSLVSNPGDLTNTQDTILVRDAANTLALRNSTNAQTFRWYRTFTDTSNYERGALSSAAGDFTISSETAGTGTDDIHLTLHAAGAGAVRTGAESLFATPKSAEKTIASGAITVTGTYHDVDTEADGATDDLDTINGGTDGAILILRANNAARTVVVKDGTGNIQTAGDMSLDNTQDTIMLIFDSALSAWLEISRSDNTA